MDLTYYAIDDPCQWLMESGDEAFEERHGITLGQNRDLIWNIIKETLEMKGYTGESPWCGYLVTDEEAGRMIGTCAFKKPPDKDGCVEVAYFTFPSFEGNGYATAMAQRLVKVAKTAGHVKKVIARTKPERDASTRVLQKLGFSQVAEEENPHHNPVETVWRWELPVWGICFTWIEAKCD